MWARFFLLSLFTAKCSCAHCLPGSTRWYSDTAVQNTLRFHKCSSWGRLLSRTLLYNDRCVWMRQCSTPLVSQLLFIANVADIPVVVQRQISVDVLVVPSCSS